MLNAPFKFFSVFIAVIIIFSLVGLGKIEFFQPTATEVMAQHSQLDLEERRVAMEATKVAINRAQVQEAAQDERQRDEAQAQSTMRLEQEAERHALWLWLEEVLMYAVTTVVVLIGVTLPILILYTGVRWVHIALPTPRPSRRLRFTPSSTLPSQEVLPPSATRPTFIAAPRPEDTIEWTPVKICPRRRTRQPHS